MDQSWWSTKIPGKSILINMKIKIELYGASKDLSSENVIELELKKSFIRGLLRYSEKSNSLLSNIRLSIELYDHV